MNSEHSFHVNGHQVTVDAKGHLRLLDVLRDLLGETGTKEGCGEGECGACTVLVDGIAVNSCLFPIGEAEGTSITTIAGLVGSNGELSPLQQAFVDHGGAQCGFCTPGMVMAATVLLAANPQPTAADIRRALVGNICRCTGYVQIVESVQAAAAAGIGGSA